MFCNNFIKKPRIIIKLIRRITHHNDCGIRLIKPHPINRDTLADLSPSKYAHHMTAEPPSVALIFYIIKMHHQQKLMVHFGGERWIRTTEGKPDRFTVCCHWPLGNLPIYIKFYLLSGAGDWNRTHNLLITSQLLCQLSYASI